ncbi:MAG: AIR synthase-related protein [Candidatus Nanoarchaeia archaeon]|nr:AIR synthase-related protein [Candidatus Nanoarchaeia archaeon]MDD5238936.1 AIR synthase-related protein [Candidatus Nanoarchaeia archaeon]
MNYKDAGVDNEAKEDVSKILYNAAKETWANRVGQIGQVICPFDDFSGVRAINVSNLPEGTYMGAGADGIGTKTYLAEYTGNHSTMAFDLFAMVCDDAVVRGAEPVAIISELATNSLTGRAKEAKDLALGYVRAAKAANVAVLTGETSELGSRVGGYGPFNYNWGGVAIWFAKKDRMFTGREIKPDDVLIGLAENGFRSNGLSLVRKTMENKWGPEWYKASYDEIRLADSVIQPSVIYTPAVVDMFGGYNNEPKAEIHGFAHITGGGIPEKLGRVLKPSGLGALIDDPLPTPEIMRLCQEWGNVADEDMYNTFNGGTGGITIAPKDEAENVIGIIQDHHIAAKKIGKITTDKNISIANNGFFKKEKILKFGLL